MSLTWLINNLENLRLSKRVFLIIFLHIFFNLTFSQFREYFAQIIANGPVADPMMRGRIVDYLECKNKSPLMRKKSKYFYSAYPKNHRQNNGRGWGHSGQF
jgi:hypothetical protein